MLIEVEEKNYLREKNQDKRKSLHLEGIQNTAFSMDIEMSKNVVRSSLKFCVAFIVFYPPFQIKTNLTQKLF